MYFEGIFLDLTDRTGAHPTVPFAHEDRGGIMQDVVKFFGFGNRKIIWEFTELFNEDDYFANEWFPPALKMNSNLYDDLNRAKEMYWEREINFFEYFIRRLQVYSELEASLFVKHYKGIDMEEYKSKLRKNQRTIYLPIPQKISDGLRVEYAEDRLSPVAAAAVSAVSDAMSDPVDSIKKVSDFVNQARSGQYKFEGLGGAEMNSLKLGLAASAVRSLGMNVSAQGLVSRASGQVLQSNLELLFSGMSLRTFPFVFDFAPRDEKEAEEVMLIIRTIKMAMTPSGRDSVLMTAPDLFQFTYISGKERHPFLNSFKVGVLTEMNVDYTAGGNYATYGGKFKSPVHMKMMLTFKEINPVFREDYEQMSNTPGMGGVGF